MRILGLIKNNSDPQLALDLFTKAKELDPASAFVYRQIYFAQRALGRLDEGVESLLEGLERFPDIPILYADVMGVHLEIYGRPDEAARWASRIVELGSQTLVGPATMSRIWSSVGDENRARDWVNVYAGDSNLPVPIGIRGSLAVGNNSNNDPQNRLTGAIDEIGITNRKMSEDQIKEHARVGAHGSPQ